jgi:transketolase
LAESLNLKIEKIANGIRRRVLEHTIKNKGGYLSQACSSAEILSSLYLGIMNLAPVEKPLVPKPFAGVPSNENKHYTLGYYFNGDHLENYDRFILSPTQYSLVLYAALIECGRMDEISLEEFNMDGSSLEMIGAEHSPGMEVMTGSLGQGLSQAIGMAFGRRLKNETGKTWILMSDGEFQIGMVWEAFQFMNHYKMDNIGIYIDMNGRQCDGTVSSVMTIDPLEDKLKSFGAATVTVDGHSISELTGAAKIPHKDKPLVVLCRTDPARGIAELENYTGKLHHIKIKSKESEKKFIDVLNKMKV